MKKSYLTLSYSVQSQHFYKSILAVFIFGFFSLNSAWAQDADGDGILDNIENGYCDISQKIEVIELSSEDFGTGTARTTNANVSNHSYTNSGAIPDGSYAVVSSLSPGLGFYNRTEANGNRDGNSDQFTGPSGGSNNGRYLAINMINVDNIEFYRQSIVGLDIGSDYRYRLDLAGLCNGCPQVPNFRLEIQNTAGTTLHSITSASIGMANDDVWRRAILNFTATTTSVDIVIYNNQPNGNNGNDVGVDNIVFAQLECPASFNDPDGDGIVNSLDLDSDNDGILDSVEGNVDSDLDGIMDYLDVDSDNDGCPDALEGAGGFTNADIDVAGRLTAAIDGDGVPGGTSQATTGLVTDGTMVSNACDTDNDGIPPATDIDDDNDGITDVDETCEPPFLFENAITFAAFNNDFTNVGQAIIDFDYTDNSLIVRVDGNPIHPNVLELESFEFNIGTDVQMVFADNTGYPIFLHEVSEPWKVNFNGLPRFRIILEANGDVSLFGTRETTSTYLEPMTTLDGSLFTFGGFTGGLVNIEVENLDDGGLDGFKGSITTFCDTDGDGLPDYLDLDSDNDGIPDMTEGLTDTDGDGVLDRLDLDSDNDGISDIIEAGGIDSNGDGQVDYLTPGDPSTLNDANNNGLDDTVEGTPLVVPNTDGTFGANYVDIDSDDDGIPDNIEAQTTAGYVVPTGTDTDGDGLDDAYDIDNGGIALVPVNTDAVDNPDYTDTDTDNDGVLDATENGSAVNVATGVDTDNDGLDNAWDTFDGTGNTGNPLNVHNGINPPSGANLGDEDGDGEVDYRDILDNDGDGVADNTDLDDDNDGILDTDENGGIDPFGDVDGDGIFDYIDIDAPGFVDVNLDGIDDRFDFDMDGVINQFDLDSDHDGISDIIEAGGIDADGDGHYDYPTAGDPSSIVDGNDNGIDDTIEGSLPILPNTDGTGNPNFLDIDSDDDGIVDHIEAQPTIGYVAPSGNDIDGDGIDDAYDGDDENVVGIGGATGIAIVPTNTDGLTDPDYMDTDSDEDGDLDALEAYDTDNNGVANTLPLNADADGDGLDNAYDTDNTTRDATNGGQLATDFPDLDTPGGDRDWREPLDVDWDGDGIADADDLDSDNDGIPDTDESGGLNPYSDGDSDGVPLYLDDDDGNAGIGNLNGIIEPGFDIDGDGVPNHLDLDSDNDGIFDIVESGQINPGINIVDLNNDGIIDAANAGTVGMNGLFDPLESAADSGTLANATADSDLDGIPDSNELNSDGDGCSDVLEAGFADGDSNGFLGNGTPGAGLVTNANGVVTGQGGYTTPNDNDSNTVYDFQEAGESVSITTQPTDQTVVLNANANFDVTNLGTLPVYQWQESTDSGATWNTLTNGGIYSGATSASLTINANTTALSGNMYRVIISSPVLACEGAVTSDEVVLTVLADWDGDGVADADDLDDDNDGIPDSIEGAGDTDGDGVPNRLDLDSDNDGIYDIVESGQIDPLNNVVDTNNDGIIDAANAGTVGTNGLFDPIESAPDSGTLATATADSDIDGIPDSNEINADGDGCNDTIEAGFVDGDNNGYLGNGTPGAGLITDSNGVVTGQGGYTEPADNDSNGTYDFQEVGQAVTLTTQPTDQTVILNATANFDVVGTTPVYQWQESTNSGATWNNLINAGIYSGVNTATLTINANSLTLDGNQYRVILSSPAYACDGNITSDAAVLSVVTDNDGDGIPDAIDLDDDNDGIPDSVEGTGDFDGDGIPNHFDLDADGDGVYDTNEAGFADLDADNDGVIDGLPAAFGANGLFDGIETAPDSNVINYTVLNTDGDGSPDFLDRDDDGDGVNTEFENPNPDGNLDPADAQDTDNDGIPDYLDIDDDGDGVNTNFEVSNADGDGNPNTGVAILNSDGDLLPNYLDSDDDNDGILTIYENDNTDGDGNPATGVVINTDNDSLLDYLDVDDDNDSILTIFENPDPNGDGNPDDAQDSDSDGIPDYMDIDDDGDGVYTLFENPDPNNDGNPNDAQDTDGDSVPDYLDIDDDNDTILTINENPDPNGDGNPSDAQDIDGDGIPDYLDADDDNDGILTVDEDVDGDGDPTNDDSDGDGVPNYLDIDDDGDGILTLNEGPADVDSDGYPNYLDQDADGDGIPDNVEGQLTASYANPIGDADGNGLDDAYEVGTAGIIPVNTDGVDSPDYLDTDSDNDTVPDSTEGHDFNADGEEDILPSGVDSDQDGLDDAYDGSVGDFLDPNGLTVVDNPANDLPNRDSTDEVDYRDTDDDNDGLLTAEEDGDGDGDPRNDNCDEDAFPDYLDTTSCTIIPNGFSPNGDGDNDTLIIPALAQYDNFEMEVYNRWGNIVYEYKNSGRAQPLWWNGFSEGPRTISKKKKVPVGTYYYIIRYNQGGLAPVAGWVYINY